MNEMLMGDCVVPKARSLSGFDNSTIVTKDEIELSTYAEGVIKETKFQVIDTDMAYNVILGKPWIHDMDDVPSTLHQPSQKDTSASQNDAGASEKDAVNQISTETVSKQTDVDSRPDVIQEPEENENIKITIEELEAVPLFEQWPDRRIHIGARLDLEKRDMTRIPPKVMTHKLNEDPSFILVKQKKRKQGSFKNQVIDGEDSFPLPHIDELIDATMGHELLSFLHAYSGYNQIKMDPLDE
ncbi:uncharacterized protein [Nicotiana tomentosiformis]|uniref:uncharacterized protein n=1 Tax=Nicotiana tomentosiformis TaxID=4098 RepID=UPI00388C7436